MDFSCQFEKLHFLAAEMRLAVQLSKFAPDDFEARSIARHVIVRADSFIDHARRLRSPLTKLGFQVDGFHQAKELYAKEFDGYFHIVRDRLGAHVQDLDVLQRIDLWNDVEVSKSEYFADGAVEIYRSLSELSIPGYKPYADYSILSDPCFQEALVSFNAASDAGHKVEIGADPLAATRPNTVTMLNGSAVHARAGLLVLIHRWVDAGICQALHFDGFKEVTRILYARLVTDVVSACDCLITRDLSPGSPQRMDGLDVLLCEDENPITDFAAAFDVASVIAPYRQIRNLVGAHFDVASNVTLHSLLEALDGLSVGELLDFYTCIRDVFEKVCRNYNYLGMYLGDGQELFGVIGSTESRTIPFNDKLSHPSGDSRPVRPVYLEHEHAEKIEEWFSASGEDERASVRYYFHCASQESEIEDCALEEDEEDRYRLTHRFLLESLCNEMEPRRVLKILELISQLRAGGACALTELLLRYVSLSQSRPYLVYVARCLGELAKWPDEEVKKLLVSYIHSSHPPLALSARVALFKMFVTTEGLNRINPSKSSVYSFSELDLLTEGLSSGERLMVLVMLASQFCSPSFVTFIKQFEADYLSMQNEITHLACEMVQAERAPSISDMLGKLLATGDYAGVCLFLYDELKGTSADLLVRDLVLLVCQGHVVTINHDQASRHLCGCFMCLDFKREALQVAGGLAARNRENIKFQLLYAEVLASIPEYAAELVAVVRALRRGYNLSPEHKDYLAELEASALEPKG